MKPRIVKHLGWWWVEYHGQMLGPVRRWHLALTIALSCSFRQRFSELFTR